MGIIIGFIIYILFTIGILAIVGSNRNAKQNMQQYYWKQHKVDPWTKINLANTENSNK